MGTEKVFHVHNSDCEDDMECSRCNNGESMNQKSLLLGTIAKSSISKVKNMVTQMHKLYINSAILGQFMLCILLPETYFICHDFIICLLLKQNGICNF